MGIKCFGEVMTLKLENDEAVQVCIYTASCWTINFKWVNFLVCTLIVNNAIKECSIVTQSDRAESLEILREILKGIVK